MFGEPNPMWMTLTLVDCSITCLYGVLEDVLVRVDKLIFPVKFVIPDMQEDSKTPMIPGRRCLATGKALLSWVS